MIHKSQQLKFSLVGFIIGIAIASFIDVLVSIYFFAGLVIALTLLWTSKELKLFIIVIIMIVLGIYRYQLTIPTINYAYDKEINFTGIIVKEPDKRINHYKLTLEVDGFSGRVLVNATLYPEYKYGDRLEVDCKMRKPEPFNGFRYDRYLAKQGIYSLCYYPTIKLIDSNQTVYGSILGFKAKVQNIINRRLPEPHASLISAIVLGSRRGIPAELYDQFSRGGLSHIIAISGLHISLLSTIIFQIAINWLNRRQAIWLVSGILLVYIILIGAPASAVRAGLMGWLVMMSWATGRLNRSSNALLLAAAILLIINPRYLRDDIGFQLSVCAVYGILTFTPKLQKIFETVPIIRRVKDLLGMTIAAQLSTLPLTVFYFGRVSIIALVLNLLIIPIVPILMILTMTAIGASLVLDVLKVGEFQLFDLLFVPTWSICSYIIKIASLADLFIFSSIAI